MSKILLVEDDNNLREIYDARLQAEGYDIVSASDGEEALVVAKREHPDLIISDVMMPKISGFEMLDILRNAEDLRDVKVIMLTALGQAEDQKRADSLGADRYLVKSQVTLEDIVRVSQELLSGADAATTAHAAAVAEAPTATPAPVPAAAPLATAPVSVEPEPVSQTASQPLPTAPAVPAPVPEPTTPLQADADAAADDTQTSAQEEKTVEDQIADFVSTHSADPLPAADASPTPPSDPVSVTTTTPEQEQALAEALSDLSGESLATPAKTPQAPPATAPAPEAATESVATPAPAAPDGPQIKRSMAAVAPPTPRNEDATATDPAPAAETSKKDGVDEDDIPVHHSKVIQPLSSEEQAPKKSLDELLAEEDAKDSGLTLPALAPPDGSQGAATAAAEPVIPEAPTEITPDTFSAPEPAAPAEPAANTAPSSETATAPADASKPKTDFDPNSVAL